MHIVEKPLQFSPYQCAITGRDDGELIDFGVVMAGIDPRLYLKREVVEEAGRLIGMVQNAHVQELELRLTEMTQEISQLRKTLDAMSTLESTLEKEPTHA